MEAWLNFGNPDGIIDAFSEAYPDVDVESLTILSEDAVPRIVAESAGGVQPAVDVIYGGLPSLAPLVERDLIDKSVDWESLGVKPDLESVAGSVQIALVAYGIGFNTDKYKPEDLPNTWAELIDPKWHGKLILDPRGRPFSFLSIVWGEEATVDYVRRLIDTTSPVVIQGTTAGLLAVASGEGDILLNSKTAETEEQVKSGAPVGIKLMEAVPTEGTQLGVITGTEQPYAAQCFIAWAASDEGSAAILEADYKSNSLPPSVSPDAQIVQLETEEDLATSDATIEKLSALITGGSG